MLYLETSFDFVLSVIFTKKKKKINLPIPALDLFTENSDKSNDVSSRDKFLLHSRTSTGFLILIYYSINTYYIFMSYKKYSNCINLMFDNVNVTNSIHVK